MPWYWWIPIGVAVLVVLWLLFRNRAAPYAVSSTPAQSGVPIGTGAAADDVPDWQRRAERVVAAGAAHGASDTAEVTTATRGGTQLSDKWDPIGRNEDREPFSGAEVADIKATEARRGPGGQGAAGPQPPDQVVGAPTGHPHGVVRDDSRDTPVPAVSDSAGGDVDPTAGPATSDRMGEIADEPGTGPPSGAGGHRRE
jgi:hypothetical protein